MSIRGFKSLYVLIPNL